MPRQDQSLSQRNPRKLLVVVVVTLLAFGLLSNSSSGVSDAPEPLSAPPRTRRPRSLMPTATATRPWELGLPFLPHAAQKVAVTAVIIAGKDRTPSHPFITGDGFRAACRFIFDETTKRDSGSAALLRSYFDAMKTNDTVFVQTHFLDDFVTAMRDRTIITRPTQQLPIRLVTHNSDYSAPWEKANVRGKFGVTEYRQHREALLESDAICSAWFAQNAIVEHPKLFPIPIGIENRYNKYGVHVTQYIQHALSARPFVSRNKLLLVGFNVKTNPRERQAALDVAHSAFGDGAATFFELSPAARSMKSRRRTLQEFGAALLQHRFVLAPHGHGVDTHRLWEALYAGCVPITTASAMDARLLRRLPVVILKSFSELTPQLLGKVSDYITTLSKGGGGPAPDPDVARVFPTSGRFDMELASMAYWDRVLSKENPK